MTPNDITRAGVLAANKADLAALWAAIQVLTTLGGLPHKGRYLEQLLRERPNLVPYFWVCYNPAITLPPQINGIPNSTSGRTLPIITLAKLLAQGKADGHDIKATMSGIPVESRMVVHGLFARDFGCGCTPLLVHRALVKAGHRGLPGIVAQPPT